MGGGRGGPHAPGVSLPRRSLQVGLGPRGGVSYTNTQSPGPLYQSLARPEPQPALGTGKRTRISEGEAKRCRHPCRRALGMASAAGARQLVATH